MSRCTAVTVLRDICDRGVRGAGLRLASGALPRRPLTLPCRCVYIHLTSERRVTVPDDSTSEQGLTSPRGGLTGDPTDFTLKQAGYVTGHLHKNSR